MTASMQMVRRRAWIAMVESAWRRRSVVWLSGVRRAGKTVLAQTLSNVDYFDCERPRTRRLLDDPEAFLDSVGPGRIVLDEIHRLANPSELLKVAADHYPKTRVLATGSSTLGGSAKFRDTLTGRKVEVWLTPMIAADLVDFGNRQLDHRLLQGGLPSFFASPDVPEMDFQDWIDAYWAKDILELFRLERRQSFLRFVELVLARSGGIFTANVFGRECGVSHTTIANYLAVLEATFVAHVVRPFSSRPSTEIVAAPKVYGFDTGFVCYYRGWHGLRREDLGLLWEHYVLNEIQARLQTRDLRYWRDKRGHEIDFVWQRRGAAPAAIECKWSAGDLDPAGLRAFRSRYPRGSNFVVVADTPRPLTRHIGDLDVEVVRLEDLIAAIGGAAR